MKTNIGHLEGAAGVAGLVKSMLALHHRTLQSWLDWMANGVLGDLSLKRKLFNTKPEEGVIFVELMGIFGGFLGCFVHKKSMNTRHHRHAMWFDDLRCILSLDRGQVPPNVHFSKLNPTIDLDDFAAEIPITTTALSGTMLSSGQKMPVTWDMDGYGGTAGGHNLPNF